MQVLADREICRFSQFSQFSQLGVRAFSCEGWGYFRQLCQFSQ